MLYIILLALMLIFGVATAVYSVLFFELYGRGGRSVIRQWRIAYSKRKQINNALSRAQRAEALATSEQLRSAQAEERALAREQQADRRVARMGSYIIAEQCGDHIKAIRASNYHAKEKKILRSVQVAAENGYPLPKDEKEQLIRMLKQAHQDAIRAEEERQHQAEIKAQIREEERVQREAQRAIREAEKEARIKKAALQEAMRLLGDVHSEEIERLKQELAEAEANANRAISMAQQTKVGHIYVISNIGSFGQDVYKVGMTRRLEPMDRVRELGDASVPFGFDVHAMFSSEDAPALEAVLHRELNGYRMNRINLRKEFFRVNLQTIISVVETHHGQVDYVADPEALEYLESIAIMNEHDTLESRIEEQIQASDVDS